MSRKLLTEIVEAIVDKVINDPKVIIEDLTVDGQTAINIEQFKSNLVNKLAAADEVGEGGGSGLFPTTGTGKATGEVTGEIDGNSFQITNGGFDVFRIDISESSQTAYLRAKEGGNRAEVNPQASDQYAIATLWSSYDNDAAKSSIELYSDVDENFIEYISNRHIFTVEDHDNLDLGLGNSLLQAFNNTEDGNYAVFQATADETTATFSVNSTFNDGVKQASIYGTTTALGTQIEYTADTHTFEGTVKLNNVPEFADNAAAISGGLEAGNLYHTAGVVKIVLEA